MAPSRGLLLCRALEGAFVLLLIAGPAGAAVAAGDAPAAQAGSLKTVLDGFHKPALGAPIPLSRPLTLGIGGLSLTLSSGTVRSLIHPTEGVIGLFLSGDGGWTYQTNDPVDRQVFARNLASAAKLKAEGDSGAKDGFHSALLLATPGWIHAALHKAEDESDQPGTWELGEPATAPDPVRPEFEAAWELLPPGVVETLAWYALNVRPEPYAFALFSGGARPVCFEHDASFERAESLYALDRREGHLLPFTISRQVLPAPAGTASPMRLTHVDLDLATPDNRTGTIASDLSVVSERDGLRYGIFHLINHRDPDRWDEDEGRNPLKVTAVTDAAGAPLEFFHGSQALLVDFGRTMAREESFRLTVRTDASIFTSFDASHKDRFFELLDPGWFPVPPGVDSGVFTYSIRVKTRDPYLPVASGERVSLQHTGDDWILESRSETAGRIIAVLAGVYEVHEKSADGITIRVYSYAAERRGQGETLSALALAFVQTYAAFLGPPSSREIEIAEVPEFGFGISPHGLVLLTTEAYKPRSSAESSYYTRGINSRLAHEIAHQWFPHRAWPADPRDAWLSESFAEYLSGLAMGSLDVRGPQKIVGLKEMLNDWRTLTDDSLQTGSVLAANQLGDDNGLRRYELLYGRGPLLLHQLRTTVGEDQFRSMLRRLLETASPSGVTTEDFRRAVRDVRGVDMAWFFEDWVAKPGLAEIAWHYDVVKAPDGGTVVTGELRQEAAAFRRIVVPIVVRLPGGPRVQAVYMDKPVVPFRIPVPQRPDGVDCDPNRNTMARYHFN